MYDVRLTQPSKKKQGARRFLRWSSYIVPGTILCHCCNNSCLGGCVVYRSVQKMWEQKTKKEGVDKWRDGITTAVSVTLRETTMHAQEAPHRQDARRYGNTPCIPLLFFTLRASVFCCFYLDYGVYVYCRYHFSFPAHQLVGSLTPFYPAAFWTMYITCRGHSWCLPISPW